VTKIQKFPNSRWRTDAILKIIFGYNFVRLRRNLECGCIIARTRRLRDKNLQFRKSNMADGRHFEDCYISISEPQIVRIARNLVRRHKFYHRRRKRQKIRNSQIQNAGWTDATLKITFWL